MKNPPTAGVGREIKKNKEQKAKLQIKN